MVLERTLESPLDYKEILKESNQSILKEISPEYSLEGPMLKLKLQYFGHLMRRADSFEKILTHPPIEVMLAGKVTLTIPPAFLNVFAPIDVQLSDKVSTPFSIKPSTFVSFWHS